jgi:hypothetical protein
MLAKRVIRGALVRISSDAIWLRNTYGVDKCQTSIQISCYVSPGHPLYLANNGPFTTRRQSPVQVCYLLQAVPRRYTKEEMTIIARNERPQVLDPFDTGLAVPELTSSWMKRTRWPKIYRSCRRDVLVRLKD